MQRTYYEINNYITTTMRDELERVTIEKDGTQIYHSGKITCNETKKNTILTLRTELFLDSDSSKSSVAITIFIASEDTEYRFDTSVQNLEDAKSFVSTFVSMQVIQHR